MLNKNRAKSADPRKNIKSATTRMNKLNEKKQAENEKVIKENLEENKNNINNEFNNNNNAGKGDLSGAKVTLPIIMKEKKEEIKNSAGDNKKKSAAKINKDANKVARKPNV